MLLFHFIFHSFSRLPVSILTAMRWMLLICISGSLVCNDLPIREPSLPLSLNFRGLKGTDVLQAHNWRGRHKATKKMAIFFYSFNSDAHIFSICHGPATHAMHIMSSILLCDIETLALLIKAPIPS